MIDRRPSNSNISKSKKVSLTNSAAELEFERSIKQALDFSYKMMNEQNRLLSVVNMSSSSDSIEKKMKEIETLKYVIEFNTMKMDYLEKKEDYFTRENEYIKVKTEELLAQKSAELQKTTQLNDDIEVYQKSNRKLQSSLGSLQSLSELKEKWIQKRIISSRDRLTTLSKSVTEATTDIDKEKEKLKYDLMKSLESKKVNLNNAKKTIEELSIEIQSIKNPIGQILPNGKIGKPPKIDEVLLSACEEKLKVARESAQESESSVNDAQFQLQNFELNTRYLGGGAKHLIDQDLSQHKQRIRASNHHALRPSTTPTGFRPSKANQVTTMDKPSSVPPSAYHEASEFTKSVKSSICDLSRHLRLMRQLPEGFDAESKGLTSSIDAVILKRNGMVRVESSVDFEKKKLNLEISKLYAEQESLSRCLTDMKMKDEALQNYITEENILQSSISGAMNEVVAECEEVSNRVIESQEVMDELNKVEKVLLEEDRFAREKIASVQMAAEAKRIEAESDLAKMFAQNIDLRASINSSRHRTMEAAQKTLDEDRKLTAATNFGDQMMLLNGNGSVTNSKHATQEYGVQTNSGVFLNVSPPSKSNSRDNKKLNNCVTKQSEFFESLDRVVKSESQFLSNQERQNRRLKSHDPNSFKDELEINDHDGIAQRRLRAAFASPMKNKAAIQNHDSNNNMAMTSNYSSNGFIASPLLQKLHQDNCTLIEQHKNMDLLKSSSKITSRWKGNYNAKLPPSTITQSTYASYSYHSSPSKTPHSVSPANTFAGRQTDYLSHYKNLAKGEYGAVLLLDNVQYDSRNVTSNKRWEVDFGCGGGDSEEEEIL